ncbi:MAG: biotin--[acetyl-CoA-carboxylase] ligase [Acidobacteriota bacterium]
MNFPEYVRAVGRNWSGDDSRLVILRCPASTHQLARRIVVEYGDESAVAPASDFLAWQQSEGHGREGRLWSSPPGAGVYATLIRPLEHPDPELAVPVQTLPLRVACALAESINLLLAGKCRLKWPNDLLVGGRKLGGILIDVVSRAEAPGVAVISFGINYAAECEVPGATSLLDEAATSLDLPGFAAQLVAAVDRSLKRAESAEDTAERFAELAIHQPGDSLSWQYDGTELEGIFRGFDEHGFLRLEVDGELRVLTSGDVASVGVTGNVGATGSVGGDA